MKSNKMVRNFHKTQDLVFNNEVYQIDQRIAPVITTLWNKDIQTDSCCEGGLGNRNNPVYNDLAYIGFSGNSIFKILNILGLAETLKKVKENKTLLLKGLKVKDIDLRIIKNSDLEGKDYINIYFHKDDVEKFHSIIKNQEIKNGQER
jgi:hypothetical protein